MVTVWAELRQETVDSQYYHGNLLFKTSMCLRARVLTVLPPQLVNGKFKMLFILGAPTQQKMHIGNYW